MKRSIDLGIIPIPSTPQTFLHAKDIRAAPILRERDQIEADFAPLASGFPLPFEVVCKIAEYVIHTPASENARYRLRELINLQRVCKQLQQVSHTLMKHTQEVWKFRAVLRDYAIATHLHPGFERREELLMQRWGMNQENAVAQARVLGGKNAHEVSDLAEKLPPGVKRLRVQRFDTTGIETSAWLPQAVHVEELIIDDLQADPANLLPGLARCQGEGDLQWIEALGKWLKQHPLLETLQIFPWCRQPHDTQKDELVKALTNFAREHRNIYEIQIYEPGKTLLADDGLLKALAENACYAPKS